MVDARNAQSCSVEQMFVSANLSSELVTIVLGQIKIFQMGFQ